ncbi:Hypothetical protein NTJ_10067 [Nesidiocoris tenuis]|uniref:Uncharacterized protein n=1 Tax=Nesidiocoris tenuis TaxID=355587 RepID=A0ABN7AYJ2_9HEMI|nr:Hypothetical protein NTJ_10067 [Nesidiocoris tenuis]
MRLTFHSFGAILFPPRHFRIVWRRESTENFRFSTSHVDRHFWFLHSIFPRCTRFSSTRNVSAHLSRVGLSIEIWSSDKKTTDKRDKLLAKKPGGEKTKKNCGQICRCVCDKKRAGTIRAGRNVRLGGRAATGPTSVKTRQWGPLDVTSLTSGRALPSDGGGGGGSGSASALRTDRPASPQPLAVAPPDCRHPPPARAGR